MWDIEVPKVRDRWHYPTDQCSLSKISKGVVRSCLSMKPLGNKGMEDETF